MFELPAFQQCKCPFTGKIPSHLFYLRYRAFHSLIARIKKQSIFLGGQYNYLLLRCKRWKIFRHADITDPLANVIFCI